MTKPIPTLFIVLSTSMAAVMTLLWVRAEQQVISYSQTMDEAITLQLFHNGERMKEALSLVEMEIENMGKADNKGLLDTLPMIHQPGVKYMMDSLKSPETLTRWEKDLMRLTEGGKFIEKGYSFPFPIDRPHQSPKQKVLTPMLAPGLCSVRSYLRSLTAFEGRHGTGVRAPAAPFLARAGTLFGAFLPSVSDRF